MFICQACGQEVDFGERVGRRDECPHCAADLHACRQCRFYAPGYHNDCQENQAEYVSDKEKANFCGYFAPAGSTPSQAEMETRAAAEKAWEELLGKK